MYVIQWWTSNKEEWGKKYFRVWREESKLLSKKSMLLLLRSFYPGGLLKKYLRKIHETLEKWGRVISISRIYQIDFHIRNIARNIWHFEWSRQSLSDCFLTMSSEWVEMLEHLSLNLRRVLWASQNMTEPMIYHLRSKIIFFCPDALARRAWNIGERK